MSIVYRILALLVTFALLVGALPVAAHTSPSPLPTAPPVYLPLVASSPAEEGYHTVESVDQLLDTMAARYPHLARVEEIGQSWRYQHTDGREGYPLRALFITNEDTPGPKPVLTLIATIHARELMATEVATRFISFLLLNYGRDPDVTWILDDHTIVVVPMVNPDGHKLAEQGYMQRKNVNDSANGSCVFPPVTNSHDGVDLNRNFAYQWGHIDKPAIGPCHQTFPGQSAVSEPETSAIQQLLQTLYPDHPRPASGTPARPTTSGLFISLHSYGEAVLWPWGYTAQESPNATGVARLGYRLAELNGYDGMQANAFYPTSGTVEDWSYATLGIPSYTIEIGMAPQYDGICGGFMPDLTCLDEAGGGGVWQRNLRPLRYAARVARYPYTQPAGPHIAAVEVLSDTQTVTLTARVTSVTGVSGDVAAAQYFIATSPWHDGTPYPLTALDGTFDSPREDVQAVLSRSDVALADSPHQGQTLLLLRAKNADGVWGPIQATWFSPHNEAPPIPQVETIEAVQEQEVLRIQAFLDGGYEPVTAAQYLLESPTDQHPTPAPLQATDGVFDTAREYAETTIPLDTLLAAHTASTETTIRLTVRGQSGDRLGPPKTRTITLAQRPAEPPYTLWLPRIFIPDR